MKHYILSVVLISLFALASCTKANVQKVEPPTRQGWGAERPILKGDVDSVTATRYYTRRVSGKLEISSIEHCQGYKFNKRGDVVSSMEGNPHNIPYDRSYYTYDSEHRMTEMLWCSRDTVPEWKTLYAYNEKGVKIEEARYGSDGSKLDFSLYAYDAEGRNTEIANYDSKGVLAWVRFMKYDANGNMLEDAGYFADEKRDYKDVYTYDSANRIAEISYYNSEEQPYRRVKYVRDAEGNIVEEEVYDDIGKLSERLRYEYDAKGNVVRITPLLGANEPYAIITEYEIRYR